MKCEFYKVGTCIDEAAVMVTYTDRDKPITRRGEGWVRKPLCLYHYHKVKVDHLVVTAIEPAEFEKGE